METTKKVYDFPFDRVRDQVAGAFRRSGRQGTVADVVAATGLPKHQVETVLPAVVSQCRGQMAVTESGEILYKFPQGLTNPEKSLGKKLALWTGRALQALFKLWIMVMLVGYFALFVLILVVALVVSIALSFARRGDDDRGGEGGGILGFFLVTRVFEFFLLLWLYSGEPEHRTSGRKKPFHKAVFEFVFGVEEKAEVRAQAERKAAIALIRTQKGTVSLEELMALTGKDRAEADAFVSRLMLEYEGEPRVSDEGTLSFFFPELLKTTQDPGRAHLPDRPLIPFTKNPAKTNHWIVGFNAFNLVFGVYFLAFGLQGFQAVNAGSDNLGLLYLITTAVTAAVGHLSLASAEAWVVGVLGVVPALYSAFFFGIPAVRRWREGRKNQRIKADNLRRKVVAAVLARPTEIRLDQVQPDSELNAPGKPGPDREALKEAMVRDLAASRSVDVVSDQPLVFRIADLEREQADLARIRQTTDLSRLALGQVVFDTEDRV